MKSSARTDQVAQFFAQFFTRRTPMLNRRNLTIVLALLPLIGACQGGMPTSGGSQPATTVVQTQLPNLPLPPGTEIVAPAPDVPADIAAFSGKWGGYWDGDLPSLLVIERVSAEGDAEGVYIWGSSSRYNVRPGSSKFRTKIKGSTLSWGGTVKFDFTLTKDGKLRGERYVSGSQQGGVTMVKAP